MSRYYQSAPDDLDVPEPDKIEMAEYTVTVTLQVLVPKYNVSPGIEKDNAEAVVRQFLESVSEGADALDRSDIGDTREGNFDAGDPYEIDLKSGTISAEKSANSLLGHVFPTQYREQHQS